MMPDAKTRMLVMEKNEMMKKYFAVIDTETNWFDEVMSIGAAIADAENFHIAAKWYCVITPECSAGGIYAHVLTAEGITVDMKGSRKEAMNQLDALLQRYAVTSLFAYNAVFDCRHLAEFERYRWFDIMRLAAYRQYNTKIPERAECWKTGRLKRNYGVESIMRMLTGNPDYHEMHNAVCDAVDELKIMRLLGYGIESYSCAEVRV